jgi:hypothetical protein
MTASIYGQDDLRDLEHAMEAFVRARREREEPAD